MKDIGCTKLIYQFSAHYQDHPTQNSWYTDVYTQVPYPADFSFYHPTDPAEINGITIQSWSKPTASIPGYDWNWDHDGLSSVDKLLKACEKHGIELWLGLYLSESGDYNWWDAASFNEMGDSELAAIQYHTDRSVAMINDLNTLYGNRLAGYYIPMEIANNGIEYQKNLTAYKKMIDDISTAAGERKVSISPFYNPTITTGTPDVFYAAWDFILKDSPLDIVMLQDGVGLRPELLSTTQSDIDPWFKAIKKACENNGKEFWANIESYYNYGTPESLNSGPTNFNKFRLQVEAESQYADVLVSFSYWTFDPYEPLPEANSIAPYPEARKALYDAYKNYYDTEVKGKVIGKHTAAKTPTQKTRDVASLFSTKYGNIEGLDLSAVILNKVTDTNDNVIRQVKANTLQMDLGDGLSGVKLRNRTNLYMAIYPTESKNFIIDIYDSQLGKIDDLAIPTLEVNKWNEVDISLGNFFKNYSGTIDKVVVRTTDASVTTVYFDHIFLYGDPAPITFPNDPTYPSEDVMSIFGDSYTQLSNLNILPGSGTGMNLYSITDGGKTADCVKLGSMGSLTITHADNSIFDLSAMENFYMDVWSPDNMNIQLTLSWGDSNSASLTKNITSSSDWQSVLVPLGSIEAQSLSTIKSITISNISGTPGILYFDNVFFYRENIDVDAPLQWTGSVDSDWNNSENWYPKKTPDSNSVVYIPGKGIDAYPILSGDKADNVCKEIYFIYGSQLGRSDLLTYEKAHVQLNFGLLDSQKPQLKENDITKPFRYAAYHSEKPIVRNKWHMISNPLKKTVTGDYSFGGYTGTFLRKFDASNPKTGSALSANWTEFYTAANVELRAAEGFIFWMNNFSSSFPYLEYGKEGEIEFGLQQLNGILELPYYEDEKMSQAHRIHKYEEENHRSVFRRFDKNTGDLTNQIDNYIRGDKDEAYRFIFEKDDSPSASVAYRVFMPEAGEGRFALLGNPYMSAIDFDEFYEDNKNYIDPIYQLWTGDSFSTYNASTGEGSGDVDAKVDNLISPMQSFLVQLKEGTIPVEGRELVFNIENITPTALSTSAIMRSKKSDRCNEVLSITSSNASGAIRTVVARNEAGNSVFNEMETPKLLSSVRRVPDLYLLKPTDVGSTEMLGVSYAVIGNETIELPIALATTTKGMNTFKLNGMDSYKDTQIIFFDKELGLQEIITGREEYEYSFNYTPSVDSKGKIIPNEDRFGLLLLRMPTQLDGIENEEDILIYSDKKGTIQVYSSNVDPLHSVYLYDAQGCIIYQKQEIGSSTHEISIRNTAYPYVLIQVVTKNGMKKGKIIHVQ
ncbi:hypothetical protein LJB84_01325 [Bacteroidales bacterium OttesenSCG-928-J19]|nr:hypothetical protein [Bacteroidales bacterium OttesenSCG-928-J19]